LTPELKSKKHVNTILKFENAADKLVTRKTQHIMCNVYVQSYSQFQSLVYLDILKHSTYKIIL